MQDRVRRIVQAKWRHVAVLALAGLIVGLLSESEPSADEWPDFRRISDLGVRKDVFINHLLPVIRDINAEVDSARARLLAIDAALAGGLAPGSTECDFVRTWAKRMGIDDAREINRVLLAELHWRVDGVPASLILAQAAIESGWGTSRFTREGNNIFGIRSYAGGGGMVPAKRDAGHSYEVVMYESLHDSVRSYINNLNRHPRYHDLRTTRAELREQGLPVEGARLAACLVHYSERGDAYVGLVQAIIKENQLERFDR